MRTMAEASAGSASSRCPDETGPDAQINISTSRHIAGARHRFERACSAQLKLIAMALVTMLLSHRAGAALAARWP